MKNLLAFIVCYLISQSLVQAQSTSWFFGQQGYLDFSSGTGLALASPSPIPTSLGCTVQADANGQVLFYSNGETVYNANNAVMLNGTGLIGVQFGIWHIQETIAIPDPGNPNEYYIFNNAGNNQDLTYSKVDMTLDGGLGGVTLKNIVLQASCIKQMTAIRHANCIDYWLMTHEAGSSNYLAFQITAAGIQPPVITSIGIPTIVSGSSMGSMKFSPDGSKLISIRENYGNTSNTQKNRFDFLDFDNSTGVLSNVQSSPVGLFPPTAGSASRVHLSGEPHCDRQ